ncbi:hypothetical protein PDJAM_G00166660 [Pangasius djambal]|uniref:Uncharacterized protein n=1 Tax=Pangasius djambal TaxID=1691987 RepID=A0ACC5ZM57_9TELE|nr:hypothetical protein [Pangasius djambal]
MKLTDWLCKYGNEGISDLSVIEWKWLYGLACLNNVGMDRCLVPGHLLYACSFSDIFLCLSTYYFNAMPVK